MWSIESTPLGRVVVAPNVPQGRAVFYTTRDFHGRLDEQTVEKITAFIRERFGIEAALTTCQQVHGTNAQRAGSTPGTQWRECDSCDALWSSESNTALGIKVADCLPIAMLDPWHGVAVNIHSGWRGAAHGITDAALTSVERSSPFDSNSAMVWLGPSIRACCFEVGEEVVQQFEASYGDVARYVDRSRRKPHVDLNGLTADVLRQRGFRDDSIFDSGICTRCDGSIFHSFRRDGKTGERNLAFVVQ